MFLTQVETALTRYAMLSPGQSLVVGVSGGPDSIALLHALAALSATWSLSLTVAHLNHGFRGEEADADAHYVAAFAEQLGLAYRGEKVDVPAVQQRLHLSAQEAARQVRHAFLRRVASEVGAERIALGHTRDDRVETVLLNLLRGTGMEGLVGFPPTQFPLIRPLYDLARAETEAYCEAHNLQPRTDSSNLKTVYLRNRVRTELLPYLSTYYNTRVDDAILRMSDLLSADNSLLEALATSTLAEIQVEQTEDRLVLEAERLSALPLALQRRVLRQAIAQVRGHLTDIGFEVIEKAREAVAAGQIYDRELPATEGITIRLSNRAGRVAVWQEKTLTYSLPWQETLPVPGSIVHPATGQQLVALLCTNAEALAPTLLTAQCVWLFPRESVTPPLLVRSWLPGDRIRPRGLDGRKKLQDLFTERRVPVTERHQIPIWVDAGGAGRILAVGCLQADETGKRLFPVGSSSENPTDVLPTLSEGRVRIETELVKTLSKSALICAIL